MENRIGIANILAGIRFEESGDFKGDYAKRGDRVNGDEPYGAYGILRSNWDPWTNLLGIFGAPIQSRDAQDFVAASIIGAYFQRYGDWDLALTAWYAGPQQAAKIIQRGYTGLDSINNDAIRDFVTQSRQHAETSTQPEYAPFVRQIPQAALELVNQGSWISPVAGLSEWSRGSWMPNQLTHRGRTHAAIDVYADEGTPIVTPVAGKVTKVNTGDIGGHTAKILGNDGVEYYFAHMAEASNLQVGDTINAGWLVGYVGRSGSARNTKPHLHFSMKKDGQPVNPSTFLEQGASMGVSANLLEEAKTNLSVETPWKEALVGASQLAAGGEVTPLPSLEDWKSKQAEAPMDGALGGDDETGLEPM